MSVVEVSRDFGGRLLTLQTGKLAKQADASVLATYGETMVLVTVVSARKLGASQDFFPLTVDFQEKYYAAGKIPGGFFKREAKPSEKATLSARIIDRPIRPLFPEDYFFETNVVATVLSYDGVNETDFVASIAASAALHMSDIPFNGPVSSCKVGLINGDFVLNPPPTEIVNSSIELLVSGVKTGIVMVEGSSKEVSEKQMVDALDYAQEKMRPIFEMQDELKEKAGKEKRKYEIPLRDEALKASIKKLTWDSFKDAFSIKEKLKRYEALKGVHDKAKEKFSVKEVKSEEEKAKNKLVDLYFEELKAQYAREYTVNNKKRIDGRPYNEIRSISSETTLLPRVHGSGLFTRGETQVLSAVTLGTADDEQTIDSISGNYEKAFMLHYNFPPYSVGEARPLRPPGRREIGHGFLAERALQAMIPPKDKFPYTIRIVSEVFESNGSSSMATVCSGSLALMDAGVPIPKAIAGVAMGLIKEGDKIAVLSDILGDEDHLGDMDFKVCGTQDGITAFQMDLKIGGVSRDIMEQALEQAKEGRLHILGKMNETLSAPRADLAKYAPRIFTVKVKPEKVREVIGSGGKVVRGIIEKTGVKIDIEDSGVIHIASVDGVSAQKAIDMINAIVEEAEPGKIYEGKVTRIADFGAFIEIIPGTDGLCHISELEFHRVNRVDDVVNVGDIVRVKCLEVDPSGKIRLSRKALLPREGGGDEGGGGSGGGRGDRGGRGGGRGRDRGDSHGTESAAMPQANAPHEGVPPEELAEEGEVGQGIIEENPDEIGQPILAGFAPQPGFGGEEGRDEDRGNRAPDSRRPRPFGGGDRGPRGGGDRSGRGGPRGGGGRGGYDRGGQRTGGRSSGGGGGGYDRGGRGGGGRGGGGGGGYGMRGGGDRDRGTDRGGYDRPPMRDDRPPRDDRPYKEVDSSGYSLPYDDDDRGPKRYGNDDE